MQTRIAVSILVGLAIAAVTIIVVLVIPVSVRHAAPFGSVQTVDFNRSIAILGGEVRPNYGNFDRVKLDLRAYGSGVSDREYDFVLTIQSLDRPEIVRRVDFTISGNRIAASRSAFANDFTSVTFEQIADSAGETFYLSLERGPRNLDDIVTLWSIQSFSTVRAVDVLRAAANGYPIGLDPRQDRNALLLLMGLTLFGGAALVASVASSTVQASDACTRHSVRSLDDF